MIFKFKVERLDSDTLSGLMILKWKMEKKLSYEKNVNNVKNVYFFTSKQTRETDVNLFCSK